jgi:hypothetical protein
MKLKQSTASQEVPLGPFLDPADGATPVTGLTIANTDIKVWKRGATSLANKNSGGATHMAGGVYYCVLDATDTDTLGPLVVFIHVAGALAVKVECEVLPANVFDSLVDGSDNLQVDATQIEGSDATNQIRDAVVDDATRIDASALNTLSSHDPGEAIMGATDLGTGAGLTSLASQTSVDDLPTNAELATALGTADDAVLAQVALVKAKTDNLPSDPADASIIAAATDAILTAVADVPTNAELATALAGADDAVLAAVAVVDGIVENLVSGILFGTAATGTLSTTQATTNLSGYADDQLIGRVVIWLSGACEGEASDITDYASSGGMLTFTALTTAPGNGDTFKIV